MVCSSPMETLPNRREKETVAAPGFLVWLIAVMLLTVLLGPVINSEGWASWDEARRTRKTVYWLWHVVITTAIAFVPSIRPMFRLLHVVPWLFGILFALMILLEITKGTLGWLQAGRIIYVGACAVAWFGFLRRYPFVVQSYKYSDAEWRKLTRLFRSETQ